MISLKDIQALNYQVGRFAQAAGWLPGAVPHFVIEFATLSQLKTAEFDLLRALADAPLPVNPDGIRRGAGFIEMDCMGIVFRLCCREKVMTSDGPMGVEDLGRPSKVPGGFGVEIERRKHKGWDQ